MAGRLFLMLELVDLGMSQGRGMTVGLPMSDAASTLRHPMAEEEARALLQLLESSEGEPDLRAVPFRMRDSMKVLSRGPQRARIERLHALYRRPFRPDFADQKMISLFEDAILPELAMALKEDAGALKERLRAKQPVFDPNAPEAPPEPDSAPRRPQAPFELPNYGYLGAFTVEEALVVGEPGNTLSTADQPPEEDPRHNVHLDAQVGQYLAFVREEDGRAVELLCVHESHKDRLLTLRHDTHEVCSVIVEGGRIAFIDRAVRTAPELVDEMEFPLYAEGLLKDRGVFVATGAAGVFPVRAARDRARTVLVSVEFSDFGVGSTSSP